MELSRESIGGRLGKSDVALIRCERAVRIVEGDDPCILLIAPLVVSAVNPEAGKAGDGFRQFEWANQPEDELLLPTPGATVCLVPHPHGVAPVLIVGEYRLTCVWAGPVVYFFYLYDLEFDASSYLGRVFEVRGIRHCRC